LFRQPRAGLSGRRFDILKFRTMTDVSGPDGRPLPDADRMTRMGRSLRQWSLDELPELLNVVKGDMSLVGPRPLHLHYLDRYTPRQGRRHETKPGITGWAQVNGRNALTWEDRFEMDVWYVDHVGWWLDVTILWRTLATLGRSDGISHDRHATMPEFRGNDERS
jgi:lipopolysaccharide/colanic/teichoic acid biosynthesis glycosyltransferase